MSKDHIGSLRGCKIFVAEDEYYLADDIARALTNLGSEVLGPVPDRDKALALIERSDRIDAAILDIKLQGESVFDVADALIARGVPLVFATGYDRKTLPLRFQDVRRWEKPFAPERLIPRLVDLLTRK